MPKQELPCPFCSKTLSHRAGLASHVRSAHSKQYAKWRARKVVASASEPSSPTTSVQTPERPIPPSPVIAEAGETERTEAQNPTLDLLNKAHAQLLERKQLVEEGLRRFDDLRRELETINAQVESLENTLSVFGTAAAPESPQHSENPGEVQEPGAVDVVDAAHDPEFTGNKRSFVAEIVKSRSASGITPVEIDRIFTARKIARSKNLIYNALSILVKQGTMRRKDGRYFAASEKTPGA